MKKINSLNDSLLKDIFVEKIEEKIEMSYISAMDLLIDKVDILGSTISNHSDGCTIECKGGYCTVECKKVCSPNCPSLCVGNDSGVSCLSDYDCSGCNFPSLTYY